MSEWDAHIPGGALDQFPQENRNPGYQYGLDANQLGTWLDYHHNLLSETHSDTTAAAPVRGDVITAQGATPKWTRFAASIPGGAALRNLLGFDNGDLEPSYKVTLDATAPTTIAEGDAAAAGTSLIFSHRDHKHGAPTTWLATLHNVLDAARHGDVVTHAIARGEVLYGNSTPKIDALAKPSIKSVLTNDTTDTAWVGYQNVRATNASGSLTVAAATVVAVTFAAEDYDSNALHSTSAATSRLVAAIAGRYMVSGGVQWTAEALSTTTFVLARLSKNGTPIPGATQLTPVNGVIATTGQYQNLAIEVSLAAAEYVEIEVFFDAGAASRHLTLAGCSLGMHYVGPT